jgi:hypothetical protein
MDYSVYKLLSIDSKSSPLDILNQCKKYLSMWDLSAVEKKLRLSMSPEEATVCAQKVFGEGQKYIKSIAIMLLDPSARQCYDAWLDVQASPTPEKVSLTRARLSWFNGQANGFEFSNTMITQLESHEQVHIKRSVKRKFTTEPICRGCNEPFNFQDPYLVLHCHCTTRVGHVKCMQEFAGEINNKCPVCRQRLLHRHQVSKYLFWNVKKKFKFIS